MKKPHLIILGIRGVPAQHGGFETFAEKLSLYLINQGWNVTVYCQEEGEGKTWESNWKGIKRIHIPVKSTGAFGTVLFDAKAAVHATEMDALLLTLGYNTACFHLIQRLRGQTNLINMDGIEWKRQKWGTAAKAWFWINERAGCFLGNHLIADHPRIKDHLATRIRRDKITMIPYGGDRVEDADPSHLESFNLKAGCFSVVIARPEPENSFLEMVRAFGSKKRHHKLVVLGNLDIDNKPYHREIVEAASDEVIFPGAIYDPAVVGALRFFSKFYLHGHRVGGTNPSLVEALGAGCAVIAHDNEFNRWVAGDSAEYFDSETACAELFDRVILDSFDNSEMRNGSKSEYQTRLTWDFVLSEYEDLLTAWHPENETFTPETGSWPETKPQNTIE